MGDRTTVRAKRLKRDEFKNDVDKLQIITDENRFENAQDFVEELQAEVGMNLLRVQHAQDEPEPTAGGPS